MSSLAKDMHQTVRAACLWLPESEEFVSHGSPNFRVRGKTFASYVVNHHGDQRVALWLPAAPGAQEHHLRADPDNFYVPPYVGPRGWVGVRIDRNLDWGRIVALIREAYERVAPRVLAVKIGKPPTVKAPRRLSRSDVDPLESARGRRMLGMMRKICLKLPETRETVHFGHPVWQAGTRSFAMVRRDGARLTLCFWVGADRQNLLTADERFRIPPYIGHNGWIALDVSRHGAREEIAALALQSYRHFALKRMLKELIE
jgi:predicted DNA-binding protein (MmcQ/YjbR family)